jgi:hypothetical protein
MGGWMMYWWKLIGSVYGILGMSIRIKVEMRYQNCMEDVGGYQYTIPYECIEQLQSHMNALKNK